jgi:hypothetical protein
MKAPDDATSRGIIVTVVGTTLRHLAFEAKYDVSTHVAAA